MSLAVVLELGAAGVSLHVVEAEEALALAAKPLSAAPAELVPRNVVSGR